MGIFDGIEWGLNGDWRFEGLNANYWDACSRIEWEFDGIEWELNGIEWDWMG